MRDYSKAAPTFWTGDTGRRMRLAGRDVQVIGFYLFTCPSSNWIGLYYLPMPVLCHEVGIDAEGASKALQVLENIDFAYYDPENEIVWVPGAAKFQIAESLKANDKRILGIIKDLQKCVNVEFAKDFIRRYSDIYHLPAIEFPARSTKALVRAFQGPPKPVTETEAVTETRTEARAPTKAASPRAGGSCEIGICKNGNVAECQEAFDLFWTHYPRHEPGRKETRKAWCKAWKAGEIPPVTQLLSWVSKAKTSEQWSQRDKIPHATTWLNQRRFEGETPPPPAQKQKPKQIDILDTMLEEAIQEEQNGKSGGNQVR